MPTNFNYQELDFYYQIKNLNPSEEVFKSVSLKVTRLNQFLDSIFKLAINFGMSLFRLNQSLIYLHLIFWKSSIVF